MDIGVALEAAGVSINSNLYHKGDGLFYFLREVRGTRARLKCRNYRKGCRGTGVINLHSMQLYHLQEHNHRPDDLLLEEFDMRREMINDAARSLTGRTAGHILDHWKTSCRNPHLAMRSNVARMRSSLNRARSSNYPAIPRSLIGLGILLGLPNMRAICESIDGQDLIYQGMVGNIGDRSVCVVFTSARMLHFLQGRPNIHVDGTFRKRPRSPKCSQILNIVTNYGGCVISIVRILMMSRTEEAYRSVFSYLRDLVPNFQPMRIHCDFERAQINALRIVFLHPCEIYGCLWHYAKAVSSMARTLGLVPLATAHEDVYSFIRCLCAVPLLPSHLIWEGVLQLWQEVLDSPWAEQLLPLFLYFSREWRPRIGELSVFDCPERTNNCSESDNRSMARVLPQNYPSVWQVIGGFVRLEYLAWQDKVASDTGVIVRHPRRYSAVWNDAQINRLATMLVNGDITPVHFLHAASWHNIAPVHHGMLLEEASDSESDED